VVNPPAVPYTAALRAVGAVAGRTRTMRHTWMAIITSSVTPMTTSIGRVLDPTATKNTTPAAKPAPTPALIPRSRSHRACSRYQATANRSAVSRIGSTVPGSSRPLTTVAINGVATSAAPGSAVFERPTSTAASAPTRIDPRVNTGRRRPVAQLSPSRAYWSSGASTSSNAARSRSSAWASRSVSSARLSISSGSISVSYSSCTGGRPAPRRPAQ
jgi:hypothetical protein